MPRACLGDAYEILVGPDDPDAWKLRESMVSGQAVEVDVDGRQLRVRAVGAELAVVFRVQATPDDEEFTRKAW